MLSSVAMKGLRGPGVGEHHEGGRAPGPSKDETTSAASSQKLVFAWQVGTSLVLVCTSLVLVGTSLVLVGTRGTCVRRAA